MSLKPPSAGPSVVVPGNHDGVHLGHQALLRSARGLADPHGLAVLALTFDPHPAAVLAPERAPVPLTTIERRIELLARAGADEIRVQRFDRQFASRTPEDFLGWLADLGVAGLVVGPDFRFGKNRAGDLAMLEAFARDHGLFFDVQPAVLLSGQRVSSSGVRSAVAAGQVERAARMLGHVYDITGNIIQGDRRGRKLGYPTANVSFGPVQRPADGVYAVVARCVPLASEPAVAGEGEVHLGVANIGLRPTFSAGRSFEVHLFDFDRDIYDRRLRVAFVARLRDEILFDGADALKAQIAIDCARAREALGRADAESWSWI